MKFNEAIKLLEKGKKIKRTNWRIDREVYLILKEVDGEMKVFDSYGNLYKFDYDDIKVKNWVEKKLEAEGKIKVVRNGWGKRY